MRRIFIAINLPQAEKEKIGKKIDVLNAGFPASAVRFLSEENWHLTVSFLGYQNDEAIGPITQAIQETVAETQSFPVKFTKLVYGPPGRSPRMIWLLGDAETSQRMFLCKNILEKRLAAKGVNFKQENRPFTAHLTLARFNGPIESLPDIESDFILEFTAESFDLMESTLKRTGAEYAVMAKFKLND